MDPLAGLKRAKRIAAHTSFFKSGICVGRTFVCVVKTSPLSSTIKIFEPIDQNVRGRNKPTFRKLLQGGNDTLRIYKEFYIPVQSSSIHFLRTKLCVACVNGFEIIDPDTLDTQGLLDPSDESLDFVRRRSDNTRPKPVAIYRIENEFLLCYDGACFSPAQSYNGTDLGSTEFAFYINRGGRRSRKNFLVHWEGAPTSFGESYLHVRAGARLMYYPRLSIPIPIRTRIRAHIRRDPQRRNRLNVPSHPRQQPPLLIHRHATTGPPAHVAQLASVLS
jgi:hypothetical protein